MNCNETRTLLTPWLDDELDARATAEVEVHLRACSRCRERFSAEERVAAAIAARLREGVMPEEVWDRLQARIARRSPAHRLRWAAAAAAVLLAALALWLWRPAAPMDLLRDQVSDHLAHAGAFVSGASAADLAGPVTAFLAGRDTDWTPPAEGRADGHHDVHWVAAETGRLDGHEMLSLRVMCCGEPASIYVMGADALADLTPDLAATLAKGGVVRSTTPDGLTARLRRQGDVLVSVVSAHETGAG